MQQTYDYSSYISPFTDRYGSQEMRIIWGERYKRILWRRLWVTLAEAQQAFGLVTAEQVEDLRAHQDDIDLARSSEIEAEIRHDVMAEIRVFAEQCPVGGSIIHLGATSADIEDNAEVLRIRTCLTLIISKVRQLLGAFAKQIRKWADTPAMGFTHLQAAEPTTIGYRLAQYAQDLLIDLEQLEHVIAHLHGKGFKGAVGTSSSYAELIQRKNGTGQTNIAEKLKAMETHFIRAFGLPAFSVTTQVYPRKQDWLVANALAGIAGSLYKFAFDLRVLQSPVFGEWFEPSGSKQVSSSAMPFKRNPVQAETIDSLGRLVANLVNPCWENAAYSLLERTLDDMPNRRGILPIGFLAADEMLELAINIVSGLEVNQEAVRRNITRFEMIASTERLLLSCVERGGDRQLLHEVLREHVIRANYEVSAGHPNPLPELLIADERINRFLEPEQLATCFNLSNYQGNATFLATALATHIEEVLATTNYTEILRRII